MSKIFDTRNSGGQLVLLGGGFGLPTSDNPIIGTIPVGTIRYNTGGSEIEIWNGSSWSGIASTFVLTLTGAVTGTGSGTVNTTLNAATTDLSDVQTSSLSNGQVLTYNSGAGKWENVDPPYDVYGTFLGKPTADQVMWRIVMCRTITFPVNLTSSVAACLQAPLADVSLPILQNGVQIGSIDFASGQSVGTFTFLSQTVFVAGDILELNGPAFVDVNFLDPSWALVGART